MLMLLHFNAAKMRQRIVVVVVIFIEVYLRCE